MSVKRKIPTTVITGFLGAGKTTMLRHLLAQAQGRRIALIVNEFGDMGVDGDVLASCGVQGCAEDDIIELANGCLCCTVADEFLPAMQSLLDRANPPDHIVIETSGLALPKPLIKAFQWPEIRSRVTVDGVITVVDGAALAAGRFADDVQALRDQAQADPNLEHDNPLEEVFSDQLASADLVVLNKTDLVDVAAHGALRYQLTTQLRPGVKIISTRHGVVDPLVLLGLSAAAEDDLESRPSHHDGEDGHDHDDFESFAVSIPVLDDAARWESQIIAVLKDHDILRLKGFLALKDKDTRQVIQAVGARVERYFDRAWKDGETRLGAVVVIGQKGLDRAAIEAGLTP